jgi:hypothetical protein
MSGFWREVRVAARNPWTWARWIATAVIFFLLGYLL